MTRALLVLTTANHLRYTRMAVASFEQCGLLGVDLVIVDDASEDGTGDYCREKGIRIVTKPEPRGVTDSWNTAYRLFRDEHYDALLLANNDILIPRGALERLLKSLKQYVIVVPMSTIKGVGHQPAQAFVRHYRVDFDDTRPDSVQRIQDYLNGLPSENPVMELPFVNGFFLGLSRGILQYELPGGQLFAPGCVNVNNEDEFCRRVDAPKACCLRSFVFHFKGVSFEDYRFGEHYACERDLTWKEAKTLQQNEPATMLRASLEIAYQEGFALGQSEVDSSPAWFGYPRWMIREWVARGGRYLRMLTSRDRRARYEARCDWMWFAGMMAGRRKARRRTRQETSE